MAYDGFVRAPSYFPGIQKKLLSDGADAAGELMFKKDYRLLGGDNFEFGANVKAALVDSFSRVVGKYLYFHNRPPSTGRTRWVIFISDSYGDAANFWTRLELRIDGKRVGLLKPKGFVEFETAPKTLAVGIVVTANATTAESYFSQDPEYLRSE